MSLLVRVAPEAERGTDSGGSEQREGETHVALGERLGDQGRGDGAAFGEGAAELLGDAEHRDPELSRLGDQLGRRRAVRVRLLGDGPQLGGGEVADRLAHHRLLVIRGEVEKVDALG